MLRKVVFLGVVMLLVQNIKSQTIKDINHQREGNKILIYYSITDAKFYHLFDIELYISVDSGENFVGPLTAVEGDVGEGITAGKNKSIYWDVFKEFDQLKGNLVFDIRAQIRKNIDSKYFVLYQANHITPYGLKFGHIGLLGWYVSAFANTNFNMYDYEIDDGLVDDYPSDQYYEIKTDKKYLRYSLVIGVNYQFLKNIYLNLGVGYGYKELNYLVKEYSYNNDSYIGESYFKDISNTYSGVEIETGLMYKLNNFIISGGVGSLNFKRLDWNMGVGYCF